MQSKSIKGKSVPELKAILDKTITADFKPTLAVVFSSKSQDLKGICDVLDAEGIAIFGCTTNGEFIDEETETGSWAILLMDLNPDYFQIYLEEYPDKNYREVAAAVATEASISFNTPAFLIGISNPAADGEEVLHGFEDVFGKEVNVFGGAAGDDYAFQKTYVFTNQKISSFGLICLALDASKVKVQGIATCGWKAVGTEKTVTKSEGNHVYTIENMPAVDIMASYGGLEDVDEGNQTVVNEQAGRLPLLLQRENGEPVMRPCLMIDWTDRSFFTSGKVSQGAKVRFSLPPDWDVMDKVRKGVEELKETEMPEADALIEFSCAGRLLSFGPMMNEEIEGVRKVWNVPMVGMFSNAELCRTKGGDLEMHNGTTCCVALKEK